MKTAEGRLFLHRALLKLLRDIVVRLETARFCRTFGTLLQSGVPVLGALQNSREVIGNVILRKKLSAVGQDIKEGKGVAVALQKTAVIPEIALSMIQVGEETGRLPAMLLNVATAYEKSLRVSLRRFISLVEPALIVFMGLVIGFIVVGMMMAIFSMTDIPF